MEEARQHTVIVCDRHQCPFIADVTTRFADEHGLSQREREILTLVIDGLSPRAISEQLVISQGTVKAHLHRIYQKVGVSGRASLMQALREYSSQQ